MRLTPVFQRAISFTLFVGEPGVDLVEGTYLDLCGLDDAQWGVIAVEDDSLDADLGQGFTFGFVFPERRAGRRLDSGGDQCPELARQAGRVALSLRQILLVVYRRIWWERVQIVSPIGVDSVVIHVRPPLLQLAEALQNQNHPVCRLHLSARYEIIVVGMRAYPEPDYRVTVPDAQRPVASGYSYRVDRLRRVNPLELQSWVIRIFDEAPVSRLRSLSYMFR